MNTSYQLSKTIQNGALGGIAAAVINVGLWLVGQATLAGGLLVTTSANAVPITVPFLMVIVMSVLPGVICGVLLWALARYTKNPRLWLNIIAAVVFVLFLIPLVQFPAAIGMGVRAVLLLMHIVVAVAVLWALYTRRNN